MTAVDSATLAAMIDQTLLKPTVGYQGAAAWISASAQRGFASLCVSPFLVPLAAELLAGTSTRVCSVCGFPLGYQNTESKAEEAAHLVQLGCDEVDMVLNYAVLLEGDDQMVLEDIAAVVGTVAHHSDGRGTVKVILETGHLDESEIVRGCRIAVAAGAHQVKTSTGFGPRGATVEDVRIMRATVGPDIGVKAAGGVHDVDCALAMIEAGASRIGTSAGIEILDAFAARLG